MRSAGLTAEPDRRAHGYDASWIETGLRVSLFIAIFAYFWVGFTSLQSGADSTQLLARDGGNTLNQVSTILLVLCCAAFITLRASWAPSASVTTSLVLVLLWIAATAVNSVDVALAWKRIILCVCILIIASAFPLLATSERQFVRLMQVCLLVILFLNFASVALLPSLAKHQAHDLFEPNLAGDWRGLFLHKNIAGSAMAFGVFFGIYIARSGSALAGGLIVAGSLVFLLLSGSKTPLSILVPTLILSSIILRLRSTSARVGLMLLVVALFNLFTVGSVVFPQVGGIVEAIARDPTFTNRTDVWTFAIDQLSGRWTTGFGYRAFWGSTWLYSSGYVLETWAARAANGHNGYLDMVMSSGVPGLILLMVWLFVQPLRDVTKSIERGATSALTTLYVRIWTYCILNACLESVFFSDFGPVWFSMLIAVFGLRYQVTANLIGSAARRQN